MYFTLQDNKTSNLEEGEHEDMKIIEQFSNRGFQVDVEMNEKYYYVTD